MRERLTSAGDLWRNASYREMGEFTEAVMAMDLGLITSDDFAGVPPWTDARVVYRRARERWATDELRAGIASGRLPDWPAWSELMAEVPL